MALPTRPSTSTWRAMLEAHSALMRLCEREMQADCGISLAWYDVLIHLWEADGHARRMSELAAELLVSPSWLTRRVSAMEDAGLVERCRDSGDGRGVCAVLTPAGVELYRRAGRSHARSIRAHFLSHLEAPEAAAIEASMRRVSCAARVALRD